jgi:DNA-binding transcriptional MerR regulator
MAFEYVGVSEFARLINKGECTVRALEQRGIIHAERDSAGRRQFSLDQVDVARGHYAEKQAT